MENTTPNELQKLHEAFSALKSVNDQVLAQMSKSGEVNGDLKAKLDKIQDSMDEIDKKATARFTEVEKKAQAAERLQERIDELEGRMRKGQFTGDDPQDDPKAKVAFVKSTFFKALRGGFQPRDLRGDAGEKMGFTPDELKVLQIGDDARSGFLAPPEYINEVLMDVVEWSPIRSIARVRSTTRTSVMYPKRTGNASAAWVADLGTRSEQTNPAYGMEELPTHEMYSLIKVSQQDLEDAVFDLEAFLRMEMAEQFGVLEGTALCTGNGAKRPEGLTVNSNVSSVNSGHATQITADGLITLFYELKEAYLNNATWAMSRATLRAVRLLKDGQGNYLWAPGIRTEGRPAEILGRPYITCPDMPAIGASNKPIAFGDFRRAILIVDRISMDVLVDPFTSKTTGAVEISARRRLGGQVVMPEALKLLNIAA